MKLKTTMLFLALLMAFSVFVMSSGNAEAYTALTGAPDYAGTEVCKDCHQSNSVARLNVYDDFKKTGHPYKVRTTGGKTPIASGTPTGTQILDPLSSLLSRPTSITNTIVDVTALEYDASLCILLGVDDCAVGSPNIDADSDGYLDWGAVQYVIGGYGWKARWGIKDLSGSDKTGYVWTSEQSGAKGGQFNMLAADLSLDLPAWSSDRPDWSAYNSTTLTGQVKKYECAICHNTNGAVLTNGYSCENDDPTNRPLPWLLSDRTYNASPTDATTGGFRSHWTMDGVQCEECHGPGLAHANAPSATNITVNFNKELCAKCHIRAENTTGSGAECGGDSNPLHLTNGAKAGADSIGHHEQYNEMVGYNGDGVHAKLQCVSCHSPHKRSTKVTSTIAAKLGITDLNTSAEERGAVVSCTSCHTSRITLDHPAAVKCIDCHMAEATVSATGIGGTWGYKGDVKTHIFKIDTANASTLTRQPAGVPVTIAVNALPLRHACGKCHDAASGAKEELKTATAITDAATAVGYFAPTGRYNGGVYSNGGKIHISGTTANNLTARFNWYTGTSCYQVNLDASDNTAATTFTWTSSGGTGCGFASNTAAITTMTCTAAGTVNVSLEVDGAVSRTMAVTVKGNHALPTASMTVSTDATATSDPTGMTAMVTDGSTTNACGTVTPNTGSILILWGDGTTTLLNEAGSNAAPQTHQYGTKGTYTIRYAYKDTQGNKAMAAPQTITLPDAASALCTISGVACTGSTVSSDEDCTDAGEAAVANATIYLKDGLTIVKMGKTDSTGKYSIANVQAGTTYAVVAQKNGYTFSLVSEPASCSDQTNNNFRATSTY